MVNTYKSNQEKQIIIRNQVKIQLEMSSLIHEIFLLHKAFKQLLACKEDTCSWPLANSWCTRSESHAHIPVSKLLHCPSICTDRSHISPFYHYSFHMSFSLDSHQWLQLLTQCRHLLWVPWDSTVPR